ncbi:hypothetical protein HaLaN_03102, partial [Haematococcus lacustris]
MRDEVAGHIDSTGMQRLPNTSLVSPSGNKKGKAKAKGVPLGLQPPESLPPDWPFPSAFTE